MKLFSLNSMVGWKGSKILFSCFAVLALLWAWSGTGMAKNNNPLLRFPDVHGNTIVFVCGGDIWSVSTGGGIATRLTLHDGDEAFPKFSPAGTKIAFTGEYDGNADVYVMDVHGGSIERVTWHPAYDEVVGWHPVKNKIIFSSARSSYSRYRHLFLVSPDGTGMEELIMHEAERGSFSPEGSKIAYNRVARENRTWKRYKGGTAQDIYLFDFDKMQDSKLTKFEGTDRIPMWIGNKIYFSSDRDRVLNIYSYDTASGNIEPLTRHTEYDVRRPSEGGGSIVYELGGSIWLLDVSTGKTAEVPIEVRSDAPELRPFLKSVNDMITDFNCSPAGERALITARGEIFSVPAEKGPTRNLSRDCGAHDKNGAWSPDGKKIAYLSDRSGEYEIYLVSPGEGQESVRLTKHRDGYRHTLRWSPDSKKIAFADQTLACYILDVDSKEITLVDRAQFENVDVSLDLKPIYDFSWSPDSRYLAYSKMNPDQIYQVYIYSLDKGKTHCASNGLFNDFGPVFSRDQEHLFFISNRRFDPVFCDFEWEMVYKKAAGIYCLALTREGDALLPFQSDEVKAEAAEEDKKKKGEDEPRIDIDFGGLAQRIEHLPLPRGNYRSLAVNDQGIFYLNKDEGDFNRFEFRAIGPCDLYHFSFGERKENTVIKNVDAYRLSADGSHIVYRRGNDIGIIPAGAKDSPGDNLDLSGLRMRLDPLAEWKQIFNEAWRLERDFYYEPNMHGLDWKAMREKYGRLLERATCRQDIRFVIGELIGELNTSHTYVWGGDIQRRADRVNIGMLGVDWEIDKSGRWYTFKKIYRVPDWTQEVLPPLCRPGMEVKEGDYLLEVNGREATTDRNFYSYFEGLAGQQVKLLINDRPDKKDAREITVAPLRGEQTLRYLDWVERNRLLADKASGGKIGYIHLPDT
ncbi:MAG: PD40 domain-containing protein, partial [Candidatus Krumholzibacteriota bacterium]|nr:PD40 domain-containing protein [Candidatus Krumholzibacteriota bacterium]